ncbi:MAG: N-acetylmuramoyl-L-alanine amidase [Epsilonproteobacteria bacterium]|nr:N-acetylmuramoyl-L-alanine amidase [Campylobacterota bacterium]
MKSVPVIAVALSWFCLVSAKPEPVSELNQVFYHAAGPSSIELGKVVFYFAKEVPLEKPTITQSIEHGIKRVEFRFDGAHASRGTLAAARELFAKIDKAMCTIELQAKKGNRPSVVLRIAYNPEMVGFESDLFDAIKHEKGFMCTLLNKPLLQRLSGTMPILKTVSTSKRGGIVIDMGHGGQDHGALSLHSIAEKDITLGIGMKLSTLLRSAGFDVTCTRSDDSFVPLDVRTTLCNRCDKADIVVSIHANSGQSSASGIETFCYKPIHTSSASDLSCTAQKTYNAALLSRCNQSLSLAQSIQGSLIEQAKKKQCTVVSRGVKQAASQLLLGATKPVVLAEVGFLTNPIESALLSSDEYQQAIARGLINGICDYFTASAQV